jgi:hypothetical protein
MSGCALRRWGPGISCIKENETTSSKEMATALAAIKAAREQQDAMWHTPIIPTTLKSSHEKKRETK